MRSERVVAVTLAAFAVALGACRAVIGGDDLTFDDASFNAAAGGAGSANGGASGTSGAGGGGGSQAAGSGGGAGSGGAAGSGAAPTFFCNPVTNEGCTGAQGCDYDMSGSYSCFDPPLDAKLCGTCSSENPPFCEAGTTCVGDTCFRFCCDDGDCMGGECFKEGDGDPVGVCYVKNGNSPVCDAPKASPSGGKCVPFP